MIKPAYSVSFLLSINIFVWQNVLYFPNDLRILGGGIHTIKENTEALVVASKEIGIEVNADNTKYMVMSRDQNAGRSQNMETTHSSFETAEQFKYMGTTLANQNSIQEEIKSRLKPGNAGQHLLHNILS